MLGGSCHGLVSPLEQPSHCRDFLCHRILSRYWSRLLRGEITPFHEGRCRRRTDVALVLPPTVCGWLLLLVFGLNHPVGQVLQQWGFQFVMTWYGGVLASSVVAFPLMYRTARGAFEGFDQTLAWSGRTLGLSDTYISGAS